MCFFYLKKKKNYSVRISNNKQCSVEIYHISLSKCKIVTPEVQMMLVEMRWVSTHKHNSDTERLVHKEWLEGSYPAQFLSIVAVARTSSAVQDPQWFSYTTKQFTLQCRPLPFVLGLSKMWILAPVSDAPLQESFCNPPLNVVARWSPAACKLSPRASGQLVGSSTEPVGVSAPSGGFSG